MVAGKEAINTASGITNSSSWTRETHTFCIFVSVKLMPYGYQTVDKQKKVEQGGNQKMAEWALQNG